MRTISAALASDFSVDGKIGRALLVATLLISSYALIRYRRSLAGRPARVRYTLFSLRLVTLVLISCAVAGLRLEYESKARPRVLVSVTGTGEVVAGTEAPGVIDQERVRRETFAALEREGVEGVEADSLETQSDGFVAGMFLTDGALSAEGAEREIGRTRLLAGGSPVYVIANYTAGEGPSVAIERVSVPGRVIRGVPVAVSCTIHSRHMQGRQSLVTVSDDVKVQASARVVWASNDERQEVTISVVPKVAGWIDYSAKVEAAGVEAAALLTRPFTLHAEERKLRVLFFEGEPTWEAKFIRRALDGSGLFEVDYLAQVSRRATVGISADRREPQSEELSPGANGRDGGTTTTRDGNAPAARLHSALKSMANLSEYDSVIIGATENSLLSSAEAARLRDWVDRRGGGLVLLGGNNFSGSIIAPAGELHSLLPALADAPKSAADGPQVSRGRPLEAETGGGRVPLTPTEAGASGPLGGYLSASEGAKVDMLTGDGLVLGQLRPGATALAVSGQPGENGTGDTGATLVAAMRFGMGRTLVFAPADSWRLRTSAREDEDGTAGPFDSLWQGIVLWIASGAHPPAEIVLSDESPEERSVMTAEVRVRDSSFAPLRIERLNARLQPQTEANDSSIETVQREISFTPAPSDSSVWRARIPVLARGRFVLEIEYTADGKSGMIEKPFSVVSAPSFERGAAVDTLRRASRESGGELVSPKDIKALAARLATTFPGTSVRRTWDLREWWPLALIIPLIASAEWFARRWWRID